MKNTFSKIASLFLAFTLLLSTFSFTVDKHYCGDFLVDISFVGSSKSCGMDVENEASKTDDCCKHEIQKIEGQDELQQLPDQKITFEKQQLLISFIHSYQNLFVEIDENIDYYKDFSPPEISQDYQSLYQVYII